MTPNEELRKTICLTAVISSAVGAVQGAECSASVVGRLLSKASEDATVFDVVLGVIQHRIANARTYGDTWLAHTARDGGRLARRAAEAWDTGMVAP